MWSRVRNWFAAPFVPRVETRALVPVTRRNTRRNTRNLIELPAARQAVEFLEWLQHEDGRVGDIFSHELMEMYWEMCAWKGYRVLNWQRVGHQLSLLIGAGSRVEKINGKSQRVWAIPQRVSARVTRVERIVAIPNPRVLGPMATHVEAA